MPPSTPSWLSPPANDDERSGVLVFTRGLLPRSETFIEDHVRSIRHYRPTLVGLATVADGLPLAGIDQRHTGGGSGLDRLRLAFSPLRGRLDAIARETGAALVHAHFINNALLLLPFLRRTGLPLVVTAHGHDVAADPATMRPVDRLLYATRLKALGARADAVLCVSRTIRELAIERGLPAAKCRVAPLGIPLAPFAGFARRPASGRLLFVGRLVEKKGLAFLLEAVARVRAMGTAVDLHVVGDGPERGALERLDRVLGARARFLGAQPRSRVLAELAEAQCLVGPSVRAADGDSEGLPIALLEAQAAGVPVVAFDNGPSREAVAQGETGILVRERDGTALALAIRSVLADAALRHRLGTAAIARVAAHFDIADRSAALERLYDEVVGQRRTAADGAAASSRMNMEAVA